MPDSKMELFLWGRRTPSGLFPVAFSRGLLDELAGLLPLARDASRPDLPFAAAWSGINPLAHRHAEASDGPLSHFAARGWAEVLDRPNRILLRLPDRAVDAARDVIGRYEQQDGSGGRETTLSFAFDAGGAKVPMAILAITVAFSGARFRLIALVREEERPQVAAERVLLRSLGDYYPSPDLLE
jgi:hypothetical protein